MSKFHITKPFVEPVDDRAHPLFEDVRPMTPKEMLYRQSKNMPISVSTPAQRVKVNDRFHSGDKFEVYDYLNSKLTDVKSKINFKKSYSKSDGTIETLSSIVPSDTANENKES